MLGQPHRVFIDTQLKIWNLLSAGCTWFCGLRDMRLTAWQVPYIFFLTLFYHWCLFEVVSFPKYFSFGFAPAFTCQFSPLQRSRPSRFEFPNSWTLSDVWTPFRAVCFRSVSHSPFSLGLFAIELPFPNWTHLFCIFFGSDRVLFKFIFLETLCRGWKGPAQPSSGGRVPVPVSTYPCMSQGILEILPSAWLCIMEQMANNANFTVPRNCPNIGFVVPTIPFVVRVYSRFVLRHLLHNSTFPAYYD